MMGLSLVLVHNQLAVMATVTLHAGVDFSLRIPANAVLLTVIVAITHSCATLPPQELRYDT